MNSLAKALNKDKHEYRVPVPYPSLRALIQPLRGNLIIALGAPGIGKSAFSLNWALDIEPTSLVVSLDTDLATQAVRTCAIRQNLTLDVIKQDPKAYVDFLANDQIVRHVRCYDIGSSPRDVLALTKAEEEFWGEPPALTVVDNISNLVKEGGYEDYRKLFVELHRVARAGDTCILALHHVARSSAKDGTDLSLWSGQYSGEQEAEIVLGLQEGANSTMRVSVLKNRSGRADPTGALAVELPFEKSKMKIRDYTEEERAYAALSGYKQTFGIQTETEGITGGTA